MQQKFRIPSHSEISEETPCSSHLAFFSMNLSRHAWDHCQFGGNSVVWTKTHFPELAFKFFTFLFAKSHAVKTTRHAAITIYSFPFSFPKYRTFSTQNEIPKHQYTRMARIPFIFFFFFLLFFPRKAVWFRLQKAEQLLVSERPRHGLFFEIREQVLFKLQPVFSLERTDIFLKNKLSIQLNSTTGKYCSYPFGKICSILLLQSPIINSNKPQHTVKLSSLLSVHY